MNSLTEIMHEDPEEFVRKVKELFEALTGKPYAIVKKEHLEGSIWAIYFDESKVSMMDRNKISLGARWADEDKDGAIHVYSDNFYELNDAVYFEYGVRLRIDDDLLEKRNWEKYRKRVPGLIAELESAETIAKNANAKYGTSIKLYAGEKPYFVTSINAKGMSKEKKLKEIERHTKVMLETWGRWKESEDKFSKEGEAKKGRSRPRLYKE